MPKRVAQAWGERSFDAIDYIIQKVKLIDYSGPLPWEDVFSIRFYKDVTPEIRLFLTINLSPRKPLGITAFDSTIVIQSRVLFRNSIDTDPWMKSRSLELLKEEQGFLPCLTLSLAHEKWVKQEDSEFNPLWLMILDKIEGFPNVEEWENDFKSLLDARLGKIRSERNLIALMEEALSYERPSWVKSDGPKFSRLAERIIVMKRSGNSDKE